MSTGRPCVICSSAEKTKLVATMVAEGATDGAIAARLGGDLHRMSVSRHRRNHVEAPAKAIAAAAAKGRDVAEQRAQTLAAAEAGDPSAFVALAGIVSDLRQVHERLERTADAAEGDNQRLAVASLSAQQLRAAEVRAKIGGVGGYAAQKAPGAGAGVGGQFAVNIYFSGGRRETMSMAASVGDIIDADIPPPAAGATRVLDVLPDAETPVADPVVPAAPAASSAPMARLAAAFGGRGR